MRSLRRPGATFCLFDIISILNRFSVIENFLYLKIKPGFTIDILIYRYRYTESAKLRAPRAVVFYVLLCIMFLVPYLIPYLTCLVPYILSCPTCLSSCVLLCLMCLVYYVLSCLSCLVPCVLLSLTCLLPYVFLCPTCLLPHVLLRFTYLLPYVPSCFMSPFSLSTPSASYLAYSMC